MSQIEIVNIFDGAVGNKERILFKANDFTNVGKYLVFTTIETMPGKILDVPKYIYWFPNQEIKKDDYVLLYTGIGQNTKFSNKLGTTTYIFYWSNKYTIFNTPADSLVLIKIENWNYKKRG